MKYRWAENNLFVREKKMQDLIPDLMILKGWAMTHNH